ncbi:MAG: SDR family oxidoreductase, partial [Ktedonobacteraceae bacterium]
GNLRAYLQQHDESDLADVAYTLHVGRQRMAYRQMILCRNREEAIDALSRGAGLPRPEAEGRGNPLRLPWQSDMQLPWRGDMGSSCQDDMGLPYQGNRKGLPWQSDSRVEQRVDRPVAFLFPGVGEQFVGMARELYQQEEAFRLWVERCCTALGAQTGQYLREALFRAGDHNGAQFKETALAQAVSFTIEYALARLLMQWGIRPRATFGNGSGAYVAACLSGASSLEDALMQITRDVRLVESSSKADEVAALLREPGSLVLEIGSGQTLCSLAGQHSLCETASLLSALPASSSACEGQSASARLLATLGKLWLAGVSIDWSGFYGSERRQRLSLPTYPFERQRYWLIPERITQPAGSAVSPSAPTETSETEKAADIADWFYAPSWKQAELPLLPNSVERTAQRWLFFLDDIGIGQKIVDRLLLQGQEVITVTPGAAFYHYGETACSVAPADLADYEALFKELRNLGKGPWHIVHMWSVTSPQLEGQEVAPAVLEERGFYSLLTLAQASDNIGIEISDIDILSTDMRDVTGSERLCPEKSLLIGPCKVIPQEYPDIRCRSIDIALPQAETRKEDMLIQQLVEELMADSNEVMVALRGRHRWIQAFEPLKLTGEMPGSPFRARGVYLITGGLGGIGLALAEYLARTVQARLILTTRSGLPPRDAWDDILKRQGEDGVMSRKIHRVRELEALGAEVLVMQADVTDEGQMRGVIRQTLARFGSLHGVLHTAGVPASGLMQLKTRAGAASVLAPKVMGTRVLERVLDGLFLDFLVLFSSLSSATGGGPGQVDYCAANAFLDAYAHCHAACHGVTVAVDWGEWQWDAWDAGLAGYPPEAQAYFKERRRKFGIHFEEGIEALRRILLRKLPHIVVCTEDFPAMVEGSKHFSGAIILEEIRKVRQSRQSLQPQQVGQSPTTAYSRPALGTRYAAPQDEVEREVAAIWGELLGIEQIGIHDNFFELGGHSLMGMQLIARLRRAFQVDIRLLTLFEAPTVAELAMEIEILLIEEIKRSGELDGEEAKVCIPEMNF